jgi:hypothetical protein
MSDKSTVTMLEMYNEQAIDAGPMFFSGLFQCPPRNVFKTEKIELDVLRGDPRIAIPVPSHTSGARRVKLSKYVNKSFTPACYDLEVALNAWDMMKRMPGQDPFQSPDFLRNAATEAFSNLHELENLLKRGVELQASQVLTTGKLDLKDENGASIYVLDYALKSAHFATVGVLWADDGSAGDPLTEIENFAETVRKDGKQDPDQLIFGSKAIRNFLENPKVKARLLTNTNSLDMGKLSPSMQGNGSTFHGKIWIGSYLFEIWSYHETYIDPQTSAHTPYMPTNKLIVRSSKGRLDLAFGALPMFIPPEARAAQFIPRRMSFPGRGVDMTTNVWVTPDGKSLMLSAGSRALCVPTAGDTYGCLICTA